jgi:mono/diheme cytochrome c family protein
MIYPASRCARVLAPVLIALLAGAATASSAEDAPVSFETIGAQYDATVHPLLKSYCLRCHSTKKAKGDLDLEKMKSLHEARRDPRIWQKVLFMLENGEMPPKKSEQLSTEQSKTLRAWVRSYLNAEAHANAGDPGRVVMRRLSNSEFDNTIRDLTSIDSRPTREFPADSAAGEGFTNTGESMVMSPALFEKYLDAAQKIAAHTVLLPDGFRFSSVTARRDQTDEVIDKILGLYAQKTKLVELRMTGGHRDGRIRWGQVPLRPYVEALIQHREKLKQPGNVDTIADEAGLNPVYLGHL